MELFDTHAHLNDEQFDNIVGEVIKRARLAGVRYVLVVGTELSDSQRAVEIASHHEDVYAAVGIQPNYVGQTGPDDFEGIRELARDPKVIAIGETGLDRYWDRAPFDLQQEYFARHIQLSLDTGKPFIVHMRECGEEIVDSLNAFKSATPLKGVMHSFTGDADLAKRCMEFGLHISFAGMVTYKKSDPLRQVSASIPMDRLLVETDSPYLSPHPVRSQRPNEPALLVHTAECVAQQQGLSLPDFIQQSTRNAKRLFGLE
ncbi:MAG: TatD family hydrolase [Planctomycetota bacterium]|nr:TatD family hydrolase [Planctomycetota bacterium]